MALVLELDEGTCRWNWDIPHPGPGKSYAMKILGDGNSDYENLEMGDGLWEIWAMEIEMEIGRRKFREWKWTTHSTHSRLESKKISMWQSLYRKSIELDLAHYCQLSI